jgi:hypothetical protein
MGAAVGALSFSELSSELSELRVVHGTDGGAVTDVSAAGGDERERRGEREETGEMGGRGGAEEQWEEQWREQEQPLEQPSVNHLPRRPAPHSEPYSDSPYAPYAPYSSPP